MKTDTNNKEWYDNADLVTSLIIGVITILIILSQSFAVQNQIGAVNMLRSLLNHNSFYLFSLVYFILIKTDVGKRNFNILNIIFIALHILCAVASLFTIFQSFTVGSIFGFCLNCCILIYMIYVFLKDTRIWNDFKFDTIPFDEIDNDWYFYGISGLSIFILFINLINSLDLYGVIISLLGTIYTILFVRYIYLYKNHEDKKVEKKNRKRKSLKRGGAVNEG